MKPTFESPMISGYKIKLYPTEDQKNRMEEIFNLFRYTYNWALNTHIEYYKKHNKTMNKNEMMKIFGRMRNDEDHKWLLKIPVNTARFAIFNVYTAYKMYFSKLRRYPKFKPLTKKSGKRSFNLRGERIKFYGDMVQIEGVGKILVKNHNVPNYDRDRIQFYNCAVSYDGYEYYLSFCVNKKIPITIDHSQNEPIGIDLGIRNLAVLSDGTVYRFPKKVDKLEKRIRRLHKRVSKGIERRKKLSSINNVNYDDIPKTKGEQKREALFHKAYAKQTNIRKTFIHTMTREIVNKNPSSIVMEDLKVREMERSKKGAKELIGKIKQASFYTIRHQIEYKSAENGINFILADRSYPSTQLCSSCGFRRKKFSGHTFKCPMCGLRMDRDLNAALNLKSCAT